MREFVPFDDRWFDAGLPGALVPLPVNCSCVRAADGVFHWVSDAVSDNAIVSPLRIPSRAAVPALSSST